MEDLRWLGLDWDEGPDLGGSWGPYRQSERAEFYKAGLKDLEAKGLVYPCYCTDEELEARREKARRAGLQPHYDGTCRSLTSERKSRFEAEGRRPAHRFIVPEEEVTILDLFRGHVTFGAEMVGDFVVLRGGGLPTYNYACVIDDHGMAMTHVLRGEDHLSNTLRQEMLYRAFGWNPPHFGHLPLVLGSDREKLSKRHGDITLSRYRKQGFAPSALQNALALLGWSPGDDREVMTTEELIRDFDLGRVGRSASVFDQDKLNWIGQKHHQMAPVEVLVPLARKALGEAGLESELVQGERLTQLIELSRDYVHSAGEIPEAMGYLLREPLEAQEEARAVLRDPKARSLVEALGTDIEARSSDLDSGKLAPTEWLKEVGKGLSLKGRHLFQPVRAALTGRLSGPDLAHIIIWLGSRGVSRRLRAALHWD
jgi:glutamyl-tRNA synthetase